MKKSVLLFLALLLPGLIYVFLKSFGKNQFDVPVYYQKEGVKNLPECGLIFTIPYQLPDSLMDAVGWKGSEVTLFVEEKESSRKGLVRVGEEFGEQSYDVISLNEDNKKLKCFLVWNDSFSVVMVDREKRIRGYYNPATREETDRLTLEMKIMLKEY